MPLRIEIWHPLHADGMLGRQAIHLSVWLCLDGVRFLQLQVYCHNNPGILF
jgi:hypothetical protein